MPVRRELLFSFSISKRFAKSGHENENVDEPWLVAGVSERLPGTQS
jgi:hypothetical protein